LDENLGLAPWLLGYRLSEAMAVFIELSKEQEEQLRKVAEHLGVSPEALAKAALVDLLSPPAEDFDAAARRVLEKNAEFYRRLT
jgi:hypothetical protein